MVAKMTAAHTAILCRCTAGTHISDGIDNNTSNFDGSARQSMLLALFEMHSF